jgi:O-antigen ligase
LIKQSISFWLITAIAVRLRLWAAGSYVCRAAVAVRAWFVRLWLGSGVRALLFESRAGYPAVENALRILPRAAARSSSVLAPGIAGSGVLRTVRAFFDDIVHSFFAPLYNGSWFLQTAGQFFFVGKLTEKPRTTPLPAYFIVAAVVVTAFVLLPFQLFVMAVGGVLGGVIILWRVEVGVFVSALAVPILPTMLVVGLCGVTFLSWLVAVCVTGRVKLVLGGIDALVLIFGATVALSVLISFNRADSLPVAAVYLIFAAFYFVVRSVINTRQKLLAAVSTLALGGLLVSAFGLWQYVTGNFTMADYWIDEEMFGEGVARIYSTLANPNMLGQYLIFIVIIAFGMLYYMKGALMKLAAMGILGAAGLTMLLTHSRGAWLGLIFAMGIFTLLRDRRLIILAVIALFAAPFVLPPEVITRFMSIGDLTETSTWYRLSLWEGAVSVLRTFWLSGIGPGEDNFAFIYHLYALSAAYTRHSHNFFLQVMIEYGVVGIVAVMAAVAVFAKRQMVAGVTHTSDSARRTVAAVLLAGVAGFLLAGLMDHVWYNLRLMAFFWVIIALGASQIENAEWRHENEAKV